MEGDYESFFMFNGDELEHNKVDINVKNLVDEAWT
jgi:hypothetical protein